MNTPLYNQTLVDTGSGPTVILLHGLFGNFRMWNKTVESLRGQFHVVVPRLPIFDLLSPNANLKRIVTILHEFIEWHKYQEVILVGHAIGGQVALMYSYIHPEKVSKLVLTGSSGILDNALSDTLLNTKIIDHDFVEGMVSQAFHERTPMIEYFTEEIYLSVQNIPKRLAIGSLIRSAKQNNVTSFLNKIDHPTLLLWGLEDKLSPPEVALHFHDFLRYSELKFIKDCGHMAMVDQPETFNQNLISFLSN